MARGGRRSEVGERRGGGEGGREGRGGNRREVRRGGGII